MIFVRQKKLRNVLEKLRLFTSSRVAISTPVSPIIDFSYEK